MREDRGKSSQSFCLKSWESEVLEVGVRSEGGGGREETGDSCEKEEGDWASTSSPE